MEARYGEDSEAMLSHADYLQAAFAVSWNFCDAESQAGNWLDWLPVKSFIDATGGEVPIKTAAINHHRVDAARGLRGAAARSCQSGRRGGLGLQFLKKLY
jgi:hypothetical protein